MPEPSQGEAWAKAVTAVDAAGQDGSAFDGPWLKCGCQTVANAGDLIVVGAKWYEGSRRNGTTKRSRDLYVVTPAGLIGAGGNTAVIGAELLTKDPADRVLSRMEAALKTAATMISKFDALDPATTTLVTEIVAERRAAWVARQAELQSAIDRATAPAPITSVADAAAAIIAAGYKALAKTHHPDMGGNPDVMALLTDARNALRDLLALANEQVAA